MRPVPSHLASSAMLTHFTRGSRHHSPLDNLVAILETGVIRGGRRMVRGRQPVVCLFDLPFAELRRVLVRRNRARYQPFGIAIDRRYAFHQGARPVIYLPWREARGLLAAAELWRVVNIEFDRTSPSDWTFEREWRQPGELRLEPKRCAALVESWRDADEVYERFGGHPPCAGVIPLSELFGAA
ncbi:MAG TPA: hypothetical protein VEJ86_11175 [Candidatus Binataceae bacterium]|nr:hypothetical protein [Candidatus Binataceae bacterium]